MAECRSCRAQLRWVETENGRPMPLDVEPDPAGNVTVEASEARRGPVGVVHPGPVAGREMFTSHFATCPQAATWRKSASAPAAPRHGVSPAGREPSAERPAAVPHPTGI